ncbi:hypothetical protein VNI00_016371 [Paramarasmius palmivorus]|uniref:Vitellogenin n=1 Tax=Paramarasmius palmivorus TaxID=297713 RepID=A0AAW0BDM7_9AGAR
MSTQQAKYTYYILQDTPKELHEIDLQRLLDLTNFAKQHGEDHVFDLCYRVLRKRAASNPAEALRILPTIYTLLSTQDIEDIVRPTVQFGVDYAIRVIGNRPDILIIWILYKEQADKLHYAIESMPPGLPAAADYFCDQVRGLTNPTQNALRKIYDDTMAKCANNKALNEWMRKVLEVASREFPTWREAEKRVRFRMP